MRRAHFVVGFNNWAKTTVVNELFGRRRFSYSNAYSIAGVNAPNGFIVQSQSNDDVGMDFIRRIGIRINKTKNQNPDLVAAMCPSQEAWNDFRQIIAAPTFSAFSEFHFYLLRYKWEHHAELMPGEIKRSYGNTRSNSHFHIIDEGNIPPAQRTAEKVRQITKIMTTIYP